MNLFIDTNVFLSFYHLTSEDIEELKKLVALIETKQIHLLLPSHVQDEFFRNREAKISDALKRLKDVRFNMTFPAFCKEYKEYEELRRLNANANTMHAVLTKRIVEDARNNSLNADPVIKQIFAKATRIQLTEDIYSASLKRVELGNPPGKKGSLGDAINWESLLFAVDQSEFDDTHIVSDDADYASVLNEEVFNPYLEREWSKDKFSTIYFHRRLSDFFKDKYPQIKLASEVATDLAIQKLATSGSFASTHLAISALNEFATFSVPQVEQLAAIPVANSQVGWIAEDSDVHEFYKMLLETYGKQVSETTRKLLEDIAEIGTPNDPTDYEF